MHAQVLPLRAEGDGGSGEVLADNMWLIIIVLVFVAAMAAGTYLLSRKMKGKGAGRSQTYSGREIKVKCDPTLSMHEARGMHEDMVCGEQPEDGEVDEEAVRHGWVGESDAAGPSKETLERAPRT